jgi:hypothetical protein
MIRKASRYHGILTALIFAVPVAAFSEISLDLNAPEEHQKPDATTVAEDRPASKPRLISIELAIDLVDGSHIIGVPSFKSIPVQTAYAKMNIPLKAIASVEVNDDHETAHFELRNGDNLKGVFHLGPLEIETLFGKVSLKLEHVVRFDVSSSAKTLPDSLTRGLVMHYPFGREKGGKATDTSGKGNHGVVNGAKWVSTGKIGGAYKFDGKDDSIGVGYNPKESVWSFSIWFKTREDVYGQSVIGNYAAYDFSGPGTGLRYYGSAAKGPYLQLGGGSKSGHMNHRVNLSDGRWHHSVVSLGEGGCRFYLDGVLVGTNTVAYVPSPRKILIGGCHVAPRSKPISIWFNGIIDEVMIWSRALSEAEAKQLYNSQR